MNRNSIALMYTGILTLSFFVCGIIGVLDYFIIKILLFLALGLLLLYCIYIVVDKNENHPE
ncbi:hypothetical protein NA63_1866 [Flavobacteriaceae bacterium MAR_2010_105]|nr:hypothetical protein NA63_1866 [Flavobacteriaceae bacterium MAR_2010_105]